MDKWEYRLENVFTGKYGVDPEVAGSEANKLGEQGWEHVSRHPGAGIVSRKRW
jgi:hypothetical protein